MRRPRCARTRRGRLICALGLSSLAIFGLSSCGGLASNAVVEINGSPITKAAFEHWMHVAATSAGASTGSKAVVPEPPDYATCIAALAASSAKPGKDAETPSTAALKARCTKRYRALESSVLAYLISADWVIEEGVSLGIRLSDAEVKREFVRERVAQYPEAARFKAYLRSSGESVSDVLLAIKLRLLGQRIQRKVLAGKPVKQRQTALNAYVKRFDSKWKARTECRFGYVVPDCKQYTAAKRSPAKR